MSTKVTEKHPKGKNIRMNKKNFGQTCSAKHKKVFS